MMIKATTLAVAAAALALSAGAYAQNNTLATPSVVSPAHAAASGYGTPGATTSDSGAGSANASASNGANAGATVTAAPGANNTLATPSVKSPAAH